MSVSESPASDEPRVRFRRLGAPMSPDKIQWRQDGKPMTRGAKYFARFVAYVDPRAVQQRLDEVFPGEWSLTQELLPERGDEDGVLEVNMKATLTILGLSRSCIGSGSTFKNAASDAFKRAAVRFGVAAELYDLDVNWVEVDGDGKYAKPVEDPAVAYARRHRGAVDTPPPALRALVGDPTPSPVQRAEEPSAYVTPFRSPAAAAAKPKATFAPIPCPVCGKKMWDNTATKRGNQPDYKCQDKACDGKHYLTTQRTAATASAPPSQDEYPAAFRELDQDDLPF